MVVVGKYVLSYFAKISVPNNEQSVVTHHSSIEFNFSTSQNATCKGRNCRGFRTLWNSFDE